jgi:hypoxanthine phosphoribosyltransferase
MNKEFFEQIRTLISKGNTEQAIRAVNDYCRNIKSALYSNFILISNQYYTLKEKRTLHFGEYDTESARLVNSILSFLTELENEYLETCFDSNGNNRVSDVKEIDWPFVEQGIFVLKEKLLEESYYPSIIVGIGRGGAIIGALLSGCMKNIPILVLDRVYKWDNRRRDEDIIGEIVLKKKLDSVLLVAGELHTGNTAKKFINYFEKLGVASDNIKVLSFMKEKYPALEPDFWYYESEKPDIRLPWMLTKNYKRESLKKPI